MKKGIILFAFGKRGYAFAAYNMMKSIQHFNPKLKVSICIDSELSDQIPLDEFDSVTYLDPNLISPNGYVDPASVKCNMYKFMPYTHTLYLDVDGIVLKDIEPFLDEMIEKEGYYYTDVFDKGKKGDQLQYDEWATHDKIWKFFNLKKDTTYCTIQSSWAYVHKGKEAKKLFTEVKKYYDKGFPIEDLKTHWGGTLPDELIYSGVCSKLDLVPEIEGKPIFFGNHIANLSNEQIIADHYILSIFGNGGGRSLTKLRYLRWYDILIRKYLKPTPHLYKVTYIMKDKHLNNRTIR